MNTKHYLVISGIVGGVIGSLLTAVLVSPVTAQRDKFGEIECRKLTVVDEEGMPIVKLTDMRFGPRVIIYGKDFKPKVAIGVNDGDHGGVEVLGDYNSGVTLGIDEYGGFVEVSGKDLLSAAALKFDQDGKATVRTWNGRVWK